MEAECAPSPRASLGSPYPGEPWVRQSHPASWLGTPSHQEAGCRTHTKSKPFSIPNPKHNQTQKMGDRGKGSRTENVYSHAQGSADLADSSTTGPRRKAVSDEARPCARRAAGTRPAGGSGQAVKAVGESWRHPWSALGGSKREESRGQQAEQGQARTAR